MAVVMIGFSGGPLPCRGVDKSTGRRYVRLENRELVTSIILRAGFEGLLLGVLSAH
jgi:hypothetical protein